MGFEFAIFEAKVTIFQIAQVCTNIVPISALLELKKLLLCSCSSKELSLLQSSGENTTQSQ